MIIRFNSTNCLFVELSVFGKYVYNVYLQSSEKEVRLSSIFQLLSGSCSQTICKNSFFSTEKQYFCRDQYEQT